jgi:hypothetical protein
MLSSGIGQQRQRGHQPEPLHQLDRADHHRHLARYAVYGYAAAERGRGDAAWVRVVEQPGAGSFYRLLNASEEIVGEGLPGEDRTLVLTDTVSLHLAESSFSGSGLTAIMTPTLTFGPAAVGTYNVEFRVDSKSGDGDDPNVQDGDVLGTFTILPAGV